MTLARNLSVHSHSDPLQRKEALEQSVIFRAALRGFRIPDWVPKRFHSSYADAAIAHGESAAIHHVTGLMIENGNLYCRMAKAVGGQR